MTDRNDPPVVRFDRMTPALWDSMIPQAMQDRYRVAFWRARVRLNELRRARA